MKVCGIEIKGSEALLAVATLDAGNLVHLSLATKKLLWKTTSWQTT